MKQAVCALIYGKNDLILSVSRKNNPEDKGLPGGKVEKGESLLQAVVREVKEETGLIVTLSTMIFERMEEDFKVTTFLCWTKGEIDVKEEGVVEYVTWEQLMDSKNSFSEYNKQLRQTLR